MFLAHVLLPALLTASLIRATPIEMGSRSASQFGEEDDAIIGPFTEHFQRWLKKASKYQPTYELLLAVVEAYGATGSFGGRQDARELIFNEPVVFIHGNSDSALDNGTPTSTGWSNSIAYFKARAYSNSELYAVSYGDRNISNSGANHHSCSHVLIVRALLDAVLEYTGAAKLDVVAHSMGVTLVRRAIQGGNVSIGQERCMLGPSLTNRIDTLLGLAGANYGVPSCASIADVVPVCSDKDGFWPGLCAENNEFCSPSVYSSYLMQINAESRETPDARFVASAWSDTDEVLGGRRRHTALIPGSKAFRIFSNLSHIETKLQTAAVQFSAVTRYRLT